MEGFENRMAVLVGRFATPLAVLLIGAGLVLGMPPGLARLAVLTLLAFGIVFNRVMIYLIRREGAGTGVVLTRLFVNVLANTVTAYLMSPYWPAIWLLLALTPIATAIYSTRNATLAASASISGVILMIFASRGTGTALGWGLEAVHCAFIVLLSLLINELSQLARAASPALPPGRA